MLDFKIKNKELVTSSLLNEAAIIIQVAEGNEEAFAVIFNHYRKKIYAYAFHITASSSIADEVVQDIFLKVWISRKTLLKVTRFDAWLFIIARNHIFDALKLLARQTAAKQKMPFAQPTEVNNAEDNLMDKENAVLLQHAMEKLSPQQQLIFTLSRQHGLKHEEIASRLHISRNTVKTHLVHAIKTLRGFFHLHSDGILLLCIYFSFLS